MIPECINLREQFGSQCRVVYEESYHADRGDRARTEDPQLMVLLCRYGHLYPWQGTRLAASVDGHPNVANQLRRLRCCRIHQDGDFGELTVIFDVADFAQAAQIMRPRRRRQISPEQRAELIRRLPGGRNVPLESPTQGDRTARGGPAGAGDDLEAVSRQPGQLGLLESP